MGQGAGSHMPPVLPGDSPDHPARRGEKKTPAFAGVFLSLLHPCVQLPPAAFGLPAISESGSGQHVAVL
jgi:hypothetical protein